MPKTLGGLLWVQGLPGLPSASLSQNTKIITINVLRCYELCLPHYAVDSLLHSLQLWSLVFLLMGKSVKSSALCICKFRWEKKWRGFYSLDFANENTHSLLGDSFTQFPGLRCQLVDWAQAPSKAALSGTICLLYSVSCSKFPPFIPSLKIGCCGFRSLLFSPRQAWEGKGGWMAAY